MDSFLHIILLIINDCLSFTENWYQLLEIVNVLEAWYIEKSKRFLETRLKFHAYNLSSAWFVVSCFVSEFYCLHLPGDANNIYFTLALEGKMG